MHTFHLTVSTKSCSSSKKWPEMASDDLNALLCSDVSGPQCICDSVEWMPVVSISISLQGYDLIDQAVIPH